MPVLPSNAQGGASGSSPFDIVIPDAVLRGLSSWEMALSGHDVHRSVWPVRDVLHVLVGRLKHYCSLKGDADDELYAVRANFEALMERNASPREENGVLHRRSAVDPLVKRRRGNVGTVRGRGSGSRSVSRMSAKSKHVSFRK